ncbi:hypothetical protein [Streptomyces sp. NPDC018610]|uniref:hypothetical protein n=1 Tax=Streptomyces sp. NPDC018610 TaxID=3365049 RepID=UPI0037A7FF5D
MNELDIVVDELKAAHVDGKGAVEIALLAKEKLGSGFGAISFITCFRLAFGIPLPVLQRAQAWERFGWGNVHISDEEFDGLITPWLTPA